MSKQRDDEVPDPASTFTGRVELSELLGSEQEARPRDDSFSDRSGSLPPSRLYQSARRWDPHSGEWVTEGPEVIPDPGVTMPRMYVEPDLVRELAAFMPDSQPGFDFPEGLMNGEVPVSQPPPEEVGEDALSPVVVSALLGAGVGLAAGVLSLLLWLAYG